MTLKTSIQILLFIFIIDTALANPAISAPTPIMEVSARQPLYVYCPDASLIMEGTELIYKDGKLSLIDGYDGTTVVIPNNGLECIIGPNIVVRPTPSMTIEN